MQALGLNQSEAMASFWEKIRRDFANTGSGLYLDHAAGGPIPLPVQSRIQAYLKENASEADFAWPKWMKRLEAARETAARFINAAPEEVAFVHSTSQAMNFVAELIADKGRVLTNTAEFPSSTIPWIERDARLVFQADERGRISLEKLAALLSPGVKTVLTSYVQYATGFRQDMKRLGRLKKDRFLVVNATQGLGALPVDVKAWNADFLCSNSYKWLMAGYGGGILYVKKKWLSKFKPASAGWRSVIDAEAMNNRKFRLLPSAARYEFGCASFGTIFAVGAAMDYLMEIGREKIEKRILALTDYAAASLSKNGFEILSPRSSAEESSGIVVFRVKNPHHVWKRLIASRVFVSARGEGLRLGPHFYNTHEEIDQFLKKLLQCRDAEARTK